MSTTAEKIAELKDAIAALVAFERGDAVQWFSVSLNDWLNDIDPMFSLSQNRRIRIKPKLREWWINVDRDGHLSVFPVEAQAEYRRFPDWLECVHVREVIE